jgi:UDP-3-O-[3-hydroxymyristoyl] glucosamine N-acyltransferase
VTSEESSQSEFGGEGGFVLTAGAIADAVGGELRGDPNVSVAGVAALDRASSRDLSFLAGAKYAPLFADSHAGIVLIVPELADAPGQVPARVIVPRPHDALLSLLPRFHRSGDRPSGVHPTACLGRGVQLGDDVHIGAYAVVGAGVELGKGVTIDAHCVIQDGVEIGDDSHLYPSVTVYSGTRIGARVSIHAGARIGSDGFGYVFRDGQHAKIPHVGRCIIEEDVEIGANTAIDRGSIDDTVIGAGTKIDNLVHVAHNVRIGRLCLVMAQVGIAGSARVEDGCIIAGQAGLSGHHTIGRGATIAAQAGVFGDVPAGETWSGYPARPHKEALRAQAALFTLPAQLRRIEKLLEDKSVRE